MMNDTPHEGGLGYDPCDQNSFPYQADDPPFNRDRLRLDPISLDAAADGNLDIFEYLTEITGPNFQQNDPTSPYRTLDMALRLFVEMVNDDKGAFNDLPYPDLLAAALDTAFIWELG